MLSKSCFILAFAHSDASVLTPGALLALEVRAFLTWMSLIDKQSGSP